MKKLLIVLIIVFTSVSCSNDQMGYYNPNLPAVSVNFTLDLRSPAANQVRLPDGVYITNNYGITGIAIRNAGGYFQGYELTCPNHKPNGRNSHLHRQTPTSLIVVCKDISYHNGKEFAYSLRDGSPLDQSQKYYPLKPYPVQSSRDSNTISIVY